MVSTVNHFAGRVSKQVNEILKNINTTESPVNDSNAGISKQGDASNVLFAGSEDEQILPDLKNEAKSIIRKASSFDGAIGAILYYVKWVFFGISVVPAVTDYVIESQKSQDDVGNTGSLRRKDYLTETTLQISQYLSSVEFKQEVEDAGGLKDLVTPVNITDAETNKIINCKLLLQARLASIYLGIDGEILIVNRDKHTGEDLTKKGCVLLRDKNKFEIFQKLFKEVYKSVSSNGDKDMLMEEELTNLLKKHKCSNYPKLDEVQFVEINGKKHVKINTFNDRGDVESSITGEIISRKNYSNNEELEGIKFRYDSGGSFEEARVYVDKKYKYNMGIKLKSIEQNKQYNSLGDSENPGTSGAAYRMGRIIKKVENNLKIFLKENNADVLRFSKHSMHLYRKAKILGIDRYIDMQVVYGNMKPNDQYKHGDANSVKLLGHFISEEFNPLDKVFEPNSQEFRKMLLVTLIGIAAGFSMRDNKSHGNWVKGRRIDPTHIILDEVVRHFRGGDYSTELAVPGVPRKDYDVTQIHSDFINTLETELEQIPEHERGTVIGGFMGLAGMIYSALFDQSARKAHVNLQNNDNSDALEKDLYNLLFECELPECLTEKLPGFAERLAKFVVNYKFGQNHEEVAKFIHDVRNVCNINSDFIPQSLEFLKTLEPPL